MSLLRCLHQISPCSKDFSHDWGACPYAHTGEKGRRRDPRLFTYVPHPCAVSKMSSHGRECPRGEQCRFAHNVFEVRRDVCVWGIWVTEWYVLSCMACS
jgi:hypothetical protein